MLFLPYRNINKISLSLHVTVKAKLKAKFVQSPTDRRLSVSRDKGQRSRFQNKFYATLNLHSNQRMQDQNLSCSWRLSLKQGMGNRGMGNGEWGMENL